MSRRTVHVIATCACCDWRSEDYIDGERKAQNHYVQSGHIVNVEVAYAYRLGRASKAKQSIVQPVK